ncbi:LPXTG cell wall anchor domain-containing protein [Ancrocorticia populi]|uniref:LPXTG cell wall anchor domain-containing protein n=1 Tax=Ancrocorticia populi TaxID=2175228 RepID=UPI0023522CA3|nr:LPXTG cell wall anchor domain-containing protein [Ancrocorticia populi]
MKKPLALAIGLILGLPLAAPAAAAPEDSPYYFVDCESSEPGNGKSAETPWNSLEDLADHALEPGDTVLFKRGSTCEGELRTQGSGESGNPISVDAYGSEDDDLPVIAGGGVRDTVLLKNQEYWEIRNLEITNTDEDSEEQYTQPRRAVTVQNVDAGTLSHIRLEGLRIKDIYGESKKDLGGSGAIQLEIDTEDNVTRSKFDDVVITGNEIENVNRSGINMSTVWKCREAMAWDDPCDPQNPDAFPYVPSTGLVISHNSLRNIGGDGIVVQMNDGAVVESNFLDTGSSRYNAENAGIWVWNADNTLFQYNVVTNSQKVNQNDGTAWDADYGSRNTVFQYNLSYNNAGGGMFFCGCGDWKIEGLGYTTDATYRYNLSVGDGQAADLLDVQDNENAHRFQFLSGVTDSSSYNNIVVLPEEVESSHKINGTNSTGSSLLLANNLFVTTGEIAEDTYDSTTNVLTWLNNAFSGPANNWPAGDTNQKIAGPLLTGLTGTSPISEFMSAAPELLQAGQVIAPEGTYDIAGNPVPYGSAPDIGAFQTSNVASAQASTGDVPVRANATIEVSAVTSGTLTVENAAGLKHEAEAGSDGRASVIVRTSTDSGAELSISCTEGDCADATITDINDVMIDGSFETLKNSPWYLYPWRTWHSPWSGSESERARQAAQPRTEEGVAAGQYAAELTAEEPRIAQNNIPVQGGADYRLTSWVTSGEPVTFSVYGFTDNVIAESPIQSFEAEPGHLDERLQIPSDISAVTLVIEGEASVDNVTLTPDSAAPAVTQAPENVSVVEGQSAAFLAEFSANPDPAVHWEKLVDGEWVALTAATGLEQEDQVVRTGRLVLEDVNIDDDATTLRAVAQNSHGSVVTETVTLTVTPRADVPSIEIAAPSSVTVGSDAVAEAKVDAYPAATVKWQRSNDGDSWEDIEGSGEALEIGSVAEAGDTVYFRAIATNTFGSTISDSVAVEFVAPEDPGTDPTGPSGPATDGNLPNTGARVAGIAVAAVLLIAAGVALVVRRRSAQ